MNYDTNKRMREKREKEEKALITFLKRTKDGEYAKIDERQLAYPRVKETLSLPLVEVGRTLLPIS